MSRYEDNQIYSLEEILAEFGSGGAKPAQKEATPVEKPAPVETPVPAEKPAPPPTPVEAPAPPPVKPPVEEAPPKKKAAAPPDRVSLKDVMQDTVDAVMAEQEDGILAEPPTLKERFAALFSRRDRRLSQDTEQLWVTEPLPQPEEELEPEPDSDDALRIARRSAIRLRRSAAWSLVPTVLLTALAVVEKLGYLAFFFEMLPFLRGAVWGGLLLIAALIAMPAWRFGVQQIKKRRFSYELGTLVLAVVTLASCAYDALMPGGVSPLAAPAAAVLSITLWGRFFHSRARRDAFRLVALGDVPETVVSPTEAGVCRQKGVIAGFFHLWSVPITTSQELFLKILSSHIRLSGKPERKSESSVFLLMSAALLTVR